MNCKYEGIGWKSAVGLLCMAGMLTACEDDFGKESLQTGALSIKVAAPQGWTSGVAVDEDSPDSRCVSVDATTSDCSTPLYLHTIEADNAVAAPASRGALKEAVEHFSMSAICYTGDYDESWTPNFAYDLTCKVNGKDVTCPEALMWPAQGKVRFFAFAPVAENGSKSFTLSGSTATGTPKITYTVPPETAGQLDLMAACTDARSAAVNLKFHHILTAVKIVAAKDMIPGKITEVRLSGVYDTGTYTPNPAAANGDAADGVWTPDESSKTSYTITRDVTIGGGYTQPSGSDDLAGDRKDPIEVVGKTDDLTLLMIPQTLPAGAKLEIDFTEALSGNKYTLSADLKGTWPEGKIVIYSISPSSIHITPTIEFNKTPEDELPYSGVWHDARIKAYAAVTKAGSATSYIELSNPVVEYNFGSGTDYAVAQLYDADGNTPPVAAGSRANAHVSDVSGIKEYTGMYVLEPQSAFTALQNKFDSGDLNDFVKTKSAPFNLYSDYGTNESANCYMVGKPGYYKFPVVFGNTYKGGALNSSAITIATTNDGMNYYVDSDNNKISNYTISGAKDAVLAWQDSPGLIDDVEFISGTDGMDWVSFRVRRHSINQGNALIVVRDATKKILWSWHIWVSQHTATWMSRRTGDCCPIKSLKGPSDSKYSFTGKEYYLTKVNLGYCDRHENNDSRKFRIRFKAYLDDRELVIYKYKCGNESYDSSNSEFTQAEFKGSDAGDNTYYQWGRKDPMPGGIYNSNTTVYTFKGKGTGEKDYSELNMENKPLFDIYREGEKSYGLTRNTAGSNETGVRIPWTIQNPYVFVMSEIFNDDKWYENYRDHWHTPVSQEQPPYAVSSTSILYQMWNPKATKIVSDIQTVEEDVAKSVYDPCPAGYLVPPAQAFSAFAYNGTYKNNQVYTNTNAPEGYITSVGKIDNNRVWTVTYDGKTIEFPATGVRDKSLRSNELSSVAVTSIGTGVSKSWISEQKDTYPAFRVLTYITSSTMGEDTKKQVSLFYIDDRCSTTQDSSGKYVRIQDKSETCLTTSSDLPGIGCYQASADAYGVTVRPMLELSSYGAATP